MGSFFFVGLFLMVSVCVVYGQLQRRPVQTNPSMYPNRPQGGSGQCPWDEQRCASHCYNIGCQQAVPCTPRTAMFGCRCRYCMWSNSRSHESLDLDFFDIFK